MFIQHFKLLKDVAHLFQKIFTSISISVENMIRKQQLTSDIHLNNNKELFLFRSTKNNTTTTGAIRPLLYRQLINDEANQYKFKFSI